MKVLWINNDGGGFADYVEVKDGMTISEFLADKMPYRAPKELLIRINRQPVSSNQELFDGDRVSATPVKIEGGY